VVGGLGALDLRLGLEERHFLQVLDLLEMLDVSDGLEGLHINVSLLEEINLMRTEANITTYTSREELRTGNIYEDYPIACANSLESLFPQSLLLILEKSQEIKERWVENSNTHGHIGSDLLVVFGLCEPTLRY
jgi:hypothetical protein